MIFMRITGTRPPLPPTLPTYFALIMKLEKRPAYKAFAAANVHVCAYNTICIDFPRLQTTRFLEYAASIIPVERNNNFHRFRHIDGLMTQQPYLQRVRKQINTEAHDDKTVSSTNFRTRATWSGNSVPTWTFSERLISTKSMSSLFREETATTSAQPTNDRYNA